MKGLILSGGHGTRLRPITYTLQKQLVPIANRPIIFYVIDDLVEAGITDIGIIVGPNKDQVRATVGTGSRWKAKITYIEQDKPLGLAHCIKISRDFLGDQPFVMYLGDNILKGGIVDFVREFTEFNGDASLMLTKVSNPEAFGNAELYKDGTIKRIVEKPKKPKTDYAVVGIYAYGPIIHKAVRAIKPSARGELEISDAHQWLLDNNKKIHSSFVKDWWKDTGRPEDLLEGNQLVLDDIDHDVRGRVSKDSKILGRVYLAKGARIINGSRVQGPVVIGEGTVIDHSFIGPYSAIGAGVRIANTEVDNSIVMDECEIDCDQRIVDSLIGKNVSITAQRKTLPQGHRIVVGDQSEIEL
jgi:glucose-1-phosphate thymidylyltransferase